MNKNPYQSPKSNELNNERFQENHEWQGRHITVSVELLPNSLWTIGEVFLQVDDQLFRERSIKFKEDFEFEFEHKGQKVKGRLIQTNFAINKFNYQIIFDGETIADSAVLVKHWQLSLIVGVIIFGVVLLGAVLILFALIP